MIKYYFLAFLFWSISTSSSAQEWSLGAKGGLLIGTHSSKRPLFSYQSSVFYEHMGKWQAEGTRRLGFVAQLGYHRRGASYNAGTFNNANFAILNDLFQNISIAALIKGSYRARNFIPYYAGGIRMDVTVASHVVNPFEGQGVTPFNAGFWLGGGIEFNPPQLPVGFFLELSLSPDVTPQIFFAKGTQVQYFDPFRRTSSTRVMNEDYRVFNISLELSFGIKFFGQRDKTTSPPLDE